MSLLRCTSPYQLAYMHHVSNQAVRDQTDATRVSELTKKRRLRFFGRSDAC